MIKWLVWEAKCPFCKEKTNILLKPNEYNAYVSGASVQDAFKSKDDADREIIISGICYDCQKKVFSEDREDEDCYDEDDGSDDHYTYDDLGPNWW